MDISVVKALADAKIEGRVMHIPCSMSEQDTLELSMALRNGILLNKIPFYKIIRFYIANSQFNSMLHVNNDIDRNMFDMLPQLEEAIVYPPDDILKDTTVLWPAMNRVRNEFRLPPLKGVITRLDRSTLFSAYTSDLKTVSVDKFHPHVIKQGIEVGDCMDYALEPLLNDSKCIFNIKHRAVSQPELHAIWALHNGTLSWLDIQASLEYLPNYGKAVQQDYTLIPYVLPVLKKDTPGKITFNYMRGINTKVLQRIINKFAESLVNDESSAKDFMERYLYSGIKYKEVL